MREDILNYILSMLGNVLRTVNLAQQVTAIRALYVNS
jgi:hypothetical protein